MDMAYICYFIFQLKNLERKHQSIEEELKGTVFYTRLTLIVTVILAFLMLLQLYLGNATCPIDNETFHTHDTPAMTAPNVDFGDSHSHNEL